MMFIAIRLGASMLPAFFIAGALVFPLMNVFYMSRVLLTGGLAALFYGVESVVRIGHITTCGLLSGNCSEHSVRLVGCLIWAALFVSWPSWTRTWWRRPAARDGDDATQPDDTSGVSTAAIAMACVAALVGLGWLGNAVFGEKTESQRVATATPIVKLAPTPAAGTAGGYGLTFGLVSTAAPATGAMVEMGCHAQPAPADQPHHDSCNPYEGDTSCRAALPIACAQTGTLRQLGATAPVQGTALTSLEVASARCAAELGAGWRMASFHEQSGWQFSGQHGRGLKPATRYWVAIADQPGNCWDRR